MSILNGKLRYGAPELKYAYNRNLFNGLGISVCAHLLLLALVYFLAAGNDAGSGFKPPVTPGGLQLAALPAPETQSIPIQLLRIGFDHPAGGGGGSPRTKAPAGRAMKGDPAARELGGGGTNRQARLQARAVTHANAGTRPVPARKGSGTLSHSPATGKDTTTNAAPGAVKGARADGTGDKPAGGSGGPGIGHGTGQGVGDYNVNGIGGRGWQVRPRARYPEGSESTGTVVLRFTVEPDGNITNIIPVKRADGALVSAAMAGLRRARLRALPQDAAQVNQTATITYSFDLR